MLADLDDHVVNIGILVEHPLGHRPQVERW